MLLYAGSLTLTVLARAEGNSAAAAARTTLHTRTIEALYASDDVVVETLLLFPMAASFHSMVSGLQSEGLAKLLVNVMERIVTDSMTLLLCINAMPGSLFNARTANKFNALHSNLTASAMCSSFMLVVLAGKSQFEMSARLQEIRRKSIAFLAMARAKICLKDVVPITCQQGNASQGAECW